MRICEENLGVIVEPPHLECIIGRDAMCWELPKPTQIVSLIYRKPRAIKRFQF